MLHEAPEESLPADEPLRQGCGECFGLIELDQVTRLLDDRQRGARDQLVQPMSTVDRDPGMIPTHTRRTGTSIAW